MEDEAFFSVSNGPLSQTIKMYIILLILIYFFVGYSPVEAIGIDSMRFTLIIVNVMHHRVFIIIGILGCGALSTVATQIVVSQQPPEQDNIDGRHDDHGGGEHVVVDGRYTMAHVEHPIYNGDQTAKTTHDKRDDVNEGVDSVEPVLEMKLTHLEEFPRVQENAVDFGEQGYHIIRNALAVDKIIPEDRGDLKNK